ncbi:MAG: DUF2332 domain-containing protein [Micrococcales bacterium]|nr:DUF2332 domain-containing protein [Micrococcales bacterium]
MREAERPSGAMAGYDARLTTPENYRRWALQADGRSPPYAMLAAQVAQDPQVLSFLERLPETRRQPNLLFAAARYLLGRPADLAALRELIAGRPAELTAVMRSHRTQTNEAARCATLLPALCQLPEPLALIEVGASAGLTLLPDVYSYDYAGRQVPGTDPEAPTLRCTPIGPVPLPARTPTVTWRAGIDLNPLDPADAEDARWLQCLVWPAEGDRDERLRGALAAARRHRPVVHRGDLLDDLAGVAAAAPTDATLVVYHSAVLAYVEPKRRAAFAAAVRDVGAHWLSNEAPGVIGPVEPIQAAAGRRSFVLVRDGHEVLAATDSHGTWIAWAD